MRKIFNFNAGPGMLPEEVLRQAQEEMLDWHGLGMGIMELGHRGPEFKQVAEQTEADLRELMEIPKNYHVLFLSGGASMQFAMVPANLMGENRKSDYIDTGIWSKKAIVEAQRFGEVHVAAHMEDRIEHHQRFICIPPQEQWSLSQDASYVHYTPNETIDGIEFHFVPRTNGIPLVADMTSSILSRPINVNDFGLIYAGTQKNLGMAGLTVVIIREDLVHEPLPGLPTLNAYRTYVENHSLYNTPPTYNWYITGLILAWTKRQGGLQVIGERNKHKAKILYDVIDAYPEFYLNHIDPTCRSMMNVMFFLHDEKLTPLFLEQSTALGLVHLRGHRVSGGLRASIYNAMPEEGVQLLADFMQDFVNRYA